jgi:poly(3-hydroxybutyrate) depolymerase
MKRSALCLVLVVACGPSPVTSGGGGGGGGAGSTGGDSGGGSGASGGGAAATGGGSSSSGGGTAATGGGSGSTGGGTAAAGGGGSSASGGGTAATGGGSSASGGGTAATGGGAGSTGGGGVTGTPAAHGCFSDVSAGHHKFSCDTISYDVEIPTACASGGCGVVFDVHGLTMNGDSEDKSTGLRALGDSMGYLIVQPTAPSGLLGPSWTPVTDDAKVWSFLDDARAAMLIDPKRIHFTGFSQGGALTWRMVCAHADVLASAAPVAACDATTQQPAMPPYILDCPFDNTRSPSQMIPVLQLHGSVDGLCPFAKGTQQRDTAVAGWGLSGTPTTVSSDSHYSWTRYTSSAGGVYEFIQHDYEVPTPLLPVPLHGHCLPGGMDLTPSISVPMAFSCAPPNGFVWGQALMQFFAAHPRP